jgi:hypothetical protein
VKVTPDINVLLDVFQKREPHYAASAQVVSLVTAGTPAGVCPARWWMLRYSFAFPLRLRVSARDWKFPLIFSSSIGLRNRFISCVDNMCFSRDQSLPCF